MYGYIRFSKGELRVKEYEAYKAVYCSLCKYLGKNYGVLTRFTLSYDFTFFSLLNISVSDGTPSFKSGRCAFNPLKKCNYCTCADNLSLPAAASVIMFYYKLCDNVEDKRGIKSAAYRIARLFFKKKHKKAAARYPEIEEFASEYMKAQKKTEQSGTDSLDAAADPSGTMLGNMLSLCGRDEAQKRVLYRLGYCMGRYVYLLDAACDFERDKKSGNFNVLKNCCGSKEEAAQRVKPQLYAGVNEAQKAFELLDIRHFKSILGNVVYLGLEDTFLKELKDEKPV